MSEASEADGAAEAQNEQALAEQYESVQSLKLAHERVPDICDSVGVSQQLELHAVQVAKRADFEYPVNRDPTVIAAGAVYLVSLLENEKETQSRVADAAGVSTASIRETYIELGRHEGISVHERDCDQSQTVETEENWILQKIRGLVR